MTKRVKSKNIISFLLIVVLVISLLPFTGAPRRKAQAQRMGRMLSQFMFPSAMMVNL